MFKTLLQQLMIANISTEDWSLDALGVPAGLSEINRAAWSAS